MITTPTPIPAPLRTWMQIIALLVEAADRGTREAFENPAVHSTSLGADLVAAEAFALLPDGLRPELEELQLDDATAGLGMAGLIRAAERIARRHPIEQFPVGASSVIVGIGDLVGEVGP